MPLADRRIQDLIHESEVHGHQAVMCHYEDRLDQALSYADRAIQAHDELWQSLPDDDPHFVAAAYGYAVRLGDRAEIRRRLCLRHTDERRRARESRPALDDCLRALDAFRAGGGPVPDHLALLLPDLHLMTAEFRAWVGEPQAAVAAATRAIGRYRALDGGLVLAHALARCADLLWTAGAWQESIDARCEAIESYRPHVQRDAPLWANRYNQGVQRAPTATFETFCRTAGDLALCVGTPRPAAARVVLPALQDAVEGWAELVPVYAYPQHQHGVPMSTFTATALNMQRWLEGLGEHALAQRYYRAHQSCVPRTPHDQRWANPVRDLRADVEEVARAHA